jgi:hypothetical protein
MKKKKKKSMIWLYEVLMIPSTRMPVILVTEDVAVRFQIVVVNGTAIADLDTIAVTNNAITAQVLVMEFIVELELIVVEEDFIVDAPLLHSV